jgi:hypothetical protein
LRIQQKPLSLRWNQISLENEGFKQNQSDAGRKEKNKQVAGRAIGEKHIYGKQMVYEYLPAGLADS